MIMILGVFGVNKDKKLHQLVLKSGRFGLWHLIHTRIFLSSFENFG